MYLSSCLMVRADELLDVSSCIKTDHKTHYKIIYGHFYTLRVATIAGILNVQVASSKYKLVTISTNAYCMHK
jgi:hypothetical protein